MTCKDCIHFEVCYKKNDYPNFPDVCGDFISDEIVYIRRQFDDLDERIKTIKHLVHVTINDPKYGEVDGWLDKARQLLFTDAVTTDFAKNVYCWTWKEDNKENGL